MNEKKESSLQDLEQKRTEIQNKINNKPQNEYCSAFLKTGFKEYMNLQLQTIEKQIQEHPKNQVENDIVAHCGL